MTEPGPLTAFYGVGGRLPPVLLPVFCFLDVT